MPSASDKKSPSHWKFQLTPEEGASSVALETNGKEENALSGVGRVIRRAFDVL